MTAELASTTLATPNRRGASVADSSSVAVVLLINHAALGRDTPPATDADVSGAL
jgi:hypothetical protein